MSDTRFEKLLEPGRIGYLDIRNRIVMPAMGTALGTDEGFVTQGSVDYYEARAKGGAGIVTTEVTCVDFPRGKVAPRQPAIDNDKFVPALSKLAEAIKKRGARAFLELHHGGNASDLSLTGVETVAPSAIARPGISPPRALTVSEIAEIVGKFAQGARRAKEAGFDGVEIHGAHVYLVAQFLSSHWNMRTDGYGGTLENRARFLLEILQAIRREVGESYTVGCRINGEETHIENGTTLGEAQALARMIEKASINYISVSANDLFVPSHRPYFFPSGWATHLASGVKEVVKVPVFAVGKITPEIGEQLLQQGKADFIIMGRALRADPELPNKLSSGRRDDVRPCIGCSACEGARGIRPGAGRVCAVNPAISREREYEILPVKELKHILVVGGGPAGMEAARVAALRGHRVTMLVEESRLGGLLDVAGLINAEIYGLRKWQIAQVENLGVKKIMGKEATIPLIDSLKPDAVIFATGATVLSPNIPGIDRGNVLSSSLMHGKVSDHLKKVLSFKGVSLRRRIWALGAIPSRLFGVSFARWALGTGIGFGKRIVVLGTELPGCEMAEFFQHRGAKVTMIELPESAIAGAMPKPMLTLKGHLMRRLSEKGVIMRTKVKIDEVNSKSVVITTETGEKKRIPADTIVLTAGSRPNISLIQELKDKKYGVYVSGDCNKPVGILEAIEDGAGIAIKI